MRVGVIGVGFAGSIHARACMRIPGIDVTAIAAETTEEAEALARECFARVSPTAEELCAADDVDCVIVASPTDTHVRYATAAARAGKHVFCEKPMARTLEEAAEIGEACENAGVTLEIGHVVRYFPEYRKAKELLDAGAIGRAALVTMIRGTVPVGTTRGWYMDEDRSGRVILDLMLHDLDTARWWFGEPSRVHARTLGGDGGLDYALATLRYEDRPIVQLEASWAEHAGFRTAFEIRGETGLLTHDSRSSAQLVMQAPVSEDAPGVMPPATSRETPYVLQLRSFFSRIAARQEPEVGPREAFNSLALALTVVQAAREKKPIDWKPPL